MCSYAYGSVLNMGAFSHLVSINSVERDVASDKWQTQQPTSSRGSNSRLFLYSLSIVESLNTASQEGR